MSTSPSPSPRHSRHVARWLALPVLTTGLLSACLADSTEDSAVDATGFTGDDVDDPVTERTGPGITRGLFDDPEPT